jgi:hypothetical protein
MYNAEETGYDLVAFPEKIEACLGQSLAVLRVAENRLNRDFRDSREEQVDIKGSQFRIDSTFQTCFDHFSKP